MVVTPHGREDARVKLDPAKLLGFRNLVPVMGPDSDIGTSTDLAFTKKGTEGALA